MTDPVKLTIFNLGSVKFGAEGSPKSRAVSITQAEKRQSYRVDMTAPASASVTISGDQRSAVVKMSGNAWSVVRVVSAVTKSQPTLVKSMALTISGARPVES